MSIHFYGVGAHQFRTTKSLILKGFTRINRLVSAPIMRIFLYGFTSAMAVKSARIIKDILQNIAQNDARPRNCGPSAGVFLENNTEIVCGHIKASLQY